ncbi:MAG: TonB-dependent receptor, partial [Alphaproteobacteria bacterium]
SDTLAQTAGELGGAGGAAPNIDGGYEVSEGYGELIAPLVQDKPFFQSLTLEGGIRYSHYKVFAPTSPTYNTTTYKAGGSWEPATGLKFRGNYQRAVRAPNISELFSPVNTGLTNLSTDPCAGSNPVSNAALRAVCVAQGAPVSTIGSILNPTAGQAAVTSGGNLNLRPEKSDSYTAGIVLQPQRFLPGFSVTVDYYNIKVKGAVSSFTPGDIITQCFGAPPYTTASVANAACSQISRNPVTGGLDGDPSTTRGLLAAISNLGTIKTDGIDLGINYRRELFEGVKLGLAFQGNWTHDSKFQAAPGLINRECTGYYSVNCASIQPEFYWNTRATFTFVDNIDISVLWRHIDGVKQEPEDVANGNGPSFSGTIPNGLLAGRSVNFQKIPAYNYIDLAARLGIAENMDLTVTVSNLLDKQPPFVGSTVGSTSYNSGNTYPSTYDALGRRFAVGARLHF